MSKPQVAPVVRLGQIRPPEAEVRLLSRVSPEKKRPTSQKKWVVGLF
ncbi:MAG: hypothetical protein Q6354_02955 [Candidatus Brocadiales bacterium]|nr:hypothetical protein [Candidatus Brocadiales bacterium]